MAEQNVNVNVDGNGTIPNPQIDVDKIRTRLAEAEGSPVVEPIEPLPGTKPGETIVEPSPVTLPGTPGSASVIKPEPGKGLKHSAIWDYYKSKLGDQFTIPEEVVKGEYPEGITEEDYIVGIAQQYSQPRLPQDPFILSYMAASQDPNFNRDEWIKNATGERAVLSLPSAEFIKFYYKTINPKTAENPNGYSDDDVTQYVSSKNRIDLDREATTLKQTWDQFLKERDAQFVQQAGIPNEQDIVQKQKERDTVLQKHINSIQNVNEFYGLEFSEAEKKKFIVELPDLFKLDPKTGMSRFEERLLDDNFVLSIAPLVWLTEKGMKDKLSALKENVKENVKSKLGLTPGLSGGTPAFPQAIDPNRLV